MANRMFQMQVDSRKVELAMRRLTKALGNDVAKRELKKIKRESARPLKAAIQRLAPKDSGALAKATEIMDFPRSDDVFVGPRKGSIKLRRSVKTGRRLKKRRKQRVNSVYYAHMIEKGTKFIKARNYTSRALNNTRGEITRRLSIKTKAMLENYVKRQRS